MGFRSVAQQRWAVFGLFLTVFAVIFRDALFFGKTFAIPDISTYYHPIWSFGVRSLQSGQVPLWNPLSSFGAPHVANLQSCAFYPPTLLLYLPDLVRGFNAFVVLHLALAGFFTYLWMAHCGVSRSAALVSGFSFALSGYVMSVMHLTITLSAVSYFPAALYCFSKGLEHRGLGWTAACGAVLALQYLAGDPSIVLATSAVLLCMALGQTGHRWSAVRAIRLRYVVSWALVLLIAAGLTAFQWPYFLEYLRRGDGVLPFTSEKMMYSMPAEDLRGLLVPHLPRVNYYLRGAWDAQVWLGNYYIGTAVALLLLCVLPKLSKARVAGHALLAALGLVLALGDTSPIYPFMHEHLPALHWVRFPVRFFFLTGFAISCLAGFGYQELRETSKGSLPATWLELRWLLWSAVAAAFILSAYLFFHLKPITNYPATPLGRSLFWTDIRVWQVSVFGCLAMSSAACAMYWPAKRRAALWVLRGLIAADLIFFNVTEPTIDAKAYRAPTPVLRRVLSDPSLYRVVASPQMLERLYRDSGKNWQQAIDEQKNMLAPGLTATFGVANALGYDSVYLMETYPFKRLFSTLSDPREGRLLDMVNVKYVTSPKDELGPGFRRVAQSGDVRLFENERVLPRAFFSREAQVVRADGILGALSALDHDPERTIYLEESAPGVGPDVPLEPGDSAFVERYEPGRVTMRVKAQRQRWLFFSDAYYPGWAARIGRQELKVYRANGMFRAVRVPPGEHELVWTFEPKLWTWAAAFSLAAWLLLGCAAWSTHRRGRS